MRALPVLSIALVMLLFAASEAVSQTNLQNTGVLYLSGGSDTVYISGTFTNASGAALTNNGSLYVLQDVSNSQAGMATGTGTLYLSGSGAQSVGGTQPFLTFNLATNNSAGITLNSDLSVSGTHTFTAGIISSSATPNYLIYEAGASYAGDADAQHVNGWVRKNGATSFVFPVGNNTVERAIGLTGLSVSSSFNVNYAGPTTNTSNKSAPLVSVDPYEYWTVNRVSGGSAQVAMNWDKSKINFPVYALPDIRAANYIAGNWTSVGGSATGNVNTTGNISSSSVSAFGSFTFASVSAVLPVELLDFSAKRAAGYNLVSWTTTGEINVKNYEVHRSDDGSRFYMIGAMPARNLPSMQQYELTDNKAMGSIAYYRLRSVDIDGQYKLSGIITVYDRSVSGNFFAIANPVHDILYVSAGNMHSGNYEYRIMTSSGQTVQPGHIAISNGGTYQLSLSPAVTRGIYVIEFRKEGFLYRQQILVE